MELIWGALDSKGIHHTTPRKSVSALAIDTHPERGTDSPREAVFIGMCTILPCQKKKTKVIQARLELATLKVQVVRATNAPPRCTRSNVPIENDILQLDAR